MARTARRTLSNLFVWIILGLLMVALTGFGITNFSGTASLIGSVGTARITASDYTRALQQELNARIAQTQTPVTLRDLTAQGIDRAILDTLVARAALDHETQQMGISVSDAQVARQVHETTGFTAADRAGYEAALRDIGLSPATFEQDLRLDTARAILQQAVLGSVRAPEAFADVLTAYQAETRDISILTVTEIDLPAGLPAPSQADLQAQYENHAQAFTRPEMRTITYAWVRPAMIMDDTPVDQAAIRALYEARDADYNQPERRLVERLVYPDQAQAQAARAALDAGDSSFNELVAARGLTLDDVDMGEVRPDDLGTAAAAAVFGTGETIVIGPVESRLGPALFRINAILDAIEIPFEKAEPQLRTELSAEAARRAISDIQPEVEDLLAGGATLEELATDTVMELGQIDWHPGIDAGIAGYTTFREAAATLRNGDFPDLLTLSDGGLLAMRLDAITPPSRPPLTDIREQVRAHWQAAQLRAQLADHANTLAVRLDTGTRLEDLGPRIRQEVQIRRQDSLADLPPALVPRVFQLAAPGDTAVISGAEVAVIVRLDNIRPARRGDAGGQALRVWLTQQATQSLARDVLDAFDLALRDEVGVTLNPGIINAVHAQFP
ncbi:MAG: SurA N-terminal domain-containing protein [Rhodobacteraceae bacterium]|nr:SurA N-terminal domain-containing protein [Paracoccaceae bacterium]